VVLGQPSGEQTVYLLNDLLIVAYSIYVYQMCVCDLSHSEYYYFSFFQPDFTCPYKRRVGGQGDGPKWMCDPHRLLAQKDCLVYSIGSEGDYRFEESLIALLGSTHCEIHVFDPGHYARPGDPEKNNIHYHQWGLKSSYDFAYNAEVSLNALQGAAPAMKTFQETQKALGHESRTIEIFKIDCEKCEWSNYKDWVSADIRQILIENHGVPSPISGNQWHHEAMQVADYYDAFTANNFAMFSKEVNVDGGGNCVEFSYIKLHPDFWGPNGQPCMRARQQVATGSAAIETSTPNGRSVMVAGQQNSAAAAARIARQQAPAASAVLATSDPLQSLQSINIKQ
jgi:hypothetical protein